MNTLKQTGLVLMVVLGAGCVDGDDEGAADGLPRCEPGSETGDAPIVHPMSPTRLLRRVMLTLTGSTPSSEAYEAMANASDDAAKSALLDKTIDEALASPAFYRSMVAWGHDWISVGFYSNGLNGGAAYHGSQSANLMQCAGGTVQAGKWYVSGDHGLCDTASVPVNNVEPWWALGTTIPVLGRAGTGVRSYTTTGNKTIDCGLCEHDYWDNSIAEDPEGKCSCGPNLVYCHPGSGFANAQHRDPALAAMQVWDEPARLLAHLVWHDRPLTDLVLANYTVAPLRLRHLYVRHGRQNSHTALDDDTSWFEGPFTAPTDPEHDASDPLAWNEVVLEKLHPDMLALTPDKSASASLERTYTYDARTTTDEIEGIPAAGVLTMAGSMASFARERVRAARFIEIFTCRQFVPPPGDFTFNEFDRDPATTGTCQHCHRTMDPAASFFKRWSFRPSGTGGIFAVIGGVGRYRFNASSNVNYEPHQRWVAQFLPDTVMTPVTQAEFEANPETLLMDFLPEGTLLFGEQGDGTVGPLGFGKIVVQSGEFDRCAVRKLYERFVGRSLDETTEVGYLEALSKIFVDGGRRVRPFVKHLLTTEDFRRGL